MQSTNKKLLLPISFQIESSFFYFISQNCLSKLDRYYFEISVTELDLLGHYTSLSFQNRIQISSMNWGNEPNAKLNDINAVCIQKMV